MDAALKPDDKGLLRDEKGRLLPGTKAGPGRPKGARNRLGEAFLEAMLEDFVAHGASVIEQVRTEKPDKYLSVCASILPQELNVKVSDLDELSDSELDSTIQRLAAAISLEVRASQAPQGEAATDKTEPADKLPTIQ